ncbi:cytochrome P450 [Amniculicola lignicola CBS 123094]|uniref:Cytochrome P450 n=1 Tax=Amniculicola lignicola CBS 123094 TaxID=1392246 RepID=A0A6A5WDM2_9PLEO|nr:cytochrome P450 [Amniculicola lignicola CBS 123094]
MLEFLPHSPTLLTLLAILPFVPFWRHGQRIGITLLSFVINKYLLWKYPIRSVDGKRSIPTRPYIFPDGQGDAAKFLEGEKNSEAWAKEYGRIYRVWNGMTPEIVLTHPDDVKAVYRDSDNHSKAVNNNAGWLMGQLLGKCVGLTSTAEWRHVRAATDVSYARNLVSRHIPGIAISTRELLAKLESEGRLAQGVMNPVEDLSMLPFWQIADHLYGKLTPDQKKELESIVPAREEVFKRMIEGGVTRFAWSQFLPTKTNRQLTEFKTKWRAFNDKVYAGLIAAGECPPMVPMYQARERGEMTTENLYQTLDEMLFADLDITIAAMAWNMVYLAANPEVQTKLREEIRSAHKTEDKQEWNKYLQSSSTLLAACILEAARVKPIAAFTVPQSAPTMRILGDFLIPANTHFIVDTYALNLRNPFWEGDADQYRPERFLKRSGTEYRYQYWRFGFGPRQCMGKHLTELIIRGFLVEMLERYRLTLGPDVKWTKVPDTWITQPETDVMVERL